MVTAAVAVALRNMRRTSRCLAWAGGLHVVVQDATMLLDPAVLETASPVRRQLLGGMGDLSHPLGGGAGESDHAREIWQQDVM